MIRRILTAVLLAAWSLQAPVLASDERVIVTREVYLMGTRAHLASVAGSREEGLTTLEKAIAILSATERQLSTWIADSAISHLNVQQVGLPWRAEPALCEMFAHVYDWYDVTSGAFDPGIGPLTALWGINGSGNLPAADAVAQALRQSGLRHLDFNPATCTLTRRTSVTVDVGAFGKGEALDRVSAVLGSGPWMIDLGGQVSIGGLGSEDAAWPIAIAHPLHRQQPYLTVHLRNGSLSTTAGSERDLMVNGRRIGHVIDPKSGYPATFRGSVTVWHRQGLAADALSTALYVMGPDVGLRWAEARDLSAAFFVLDAEGSVRVRATAAFNRLLSAQE